MGAGGDSMEIVLHDAIDGVKCFFLFCFVFVLGVRWAESRGSREMIRK